MDASNSSKPAGPTGNKPAITTSFRAVSEDGRAGIDERKADGLCLELVSIGRALEGVADTLLESGKAAADSMLMNRAAALILHAARDGLIGSLVDISELVPEVAELLNESPAGRPVENIIERNLATPPDVETPERLEQRQCLAAKQIGELLQSIDRDAEAADVEMNYRLVLARLWLHLCETHPELLSHRAAAIHHDLLPGVDPWFGDGRDFRKAAWLCETVAKEISERCDLTLVQAEKITGIHRGTIHRALKHIKNNQKSGRDLRLNRTSLFQWKHQIYEPPKAKRESQKKAQSRLPADKCCAHCEETYRQVTLRRCPQCDHSLVKASNRILPRATKRNKRRPVK